MHALVNSQDHWKQQTAYCAHTSPSSFASQHDNTGCVQLGAPLSDTSPIAEFLPVARASLAGSDGSTYPSRGVVDRPNCATSSSPRNSILFEATSSRRLPVVASGPGTSTIAGADHQNSSVDPTSGKTRKRRPPKPRIELSSDQPFTTQGNPRSRVYVACLQCRTRKIRCDGTRPICYNCKQRPSTQCEYDTLPKRRGPDKTPGARPHIARGLQLNNPEFPRKRRQKQGTDDAIQSPGTSSSEPILCSQLQQPSPCQTHVVLDFAATLECTENDAPPMATGSSIVFPSVQDLHRSSAALLDAGCDSLSNSLHGQGKVEPEEVTSIDNEPSLSFTRKIWWDSLLCLYLSPNSSRLQSLSAAQRDMAARGITSDLRLVFRSSNYWFSFFHIPSFFGDFCDVERRENIQPCLVLALLAIGTFWQSSEIGMGVQGRERALRFRDEAQAALEASISTRWIDETVVQAAWVLALFEVCAHPRHSAQRAVSALTMLDSLIRCLSLTLLDVNDADASFFPPRSVPSVHEKDLHHSDPSYPSDLRHPRHCVPATTSSTGCSCKTLTLAVNWPSADEHAPLWGPAPTWRVTWTPGETRKESCRRLCWSSMWLAAGYVSYRVANQIKPPDLFISNPTNYALLFSGEFAALTSSLPMVNSPKGTIWALYDRSYLLWHSCARMRHDRSVSDSEKAQFAIKAWLEADALEAALDGHTCNLERAFLYQAREYIFNTRMCISHEFQRWIPLVTADVSNLFHRGKAEEWCKNYGRCDALSVRSDANSSVTHQAIVARRLMNGMHTVTGNNSSTLATRPFFVFWFMGQINRAISLWEYDNSLLVALDVCKAFIAVADYLTYLWPCPGQRGRYENLRHRVDNACQMASVCPPPPLDRVLLPSVIV